MAVAITDEQFERFQHSTSGLPNGNNQSGKQDPIAVLLGRRNAQTAHPTRLEDGRSLDRICGI
jgi:hypothetical protein